MLLVIPASLCNISLLNTPELGFVDDMVQASSSAPGSRCTPKNARYLRQTSRMNAWCKGMCMLYDVVCLACCMLYYVYCIGSARPEVRETAEPHGGAYPPSLSAPSYVLTTLIITSLRAEVDRLTLDAADTLAYQFIAV